MPYSKLFRSRWSALFWAAGILWTAVDVAASTPQPLAQHSNAETEENKADTASIEAIAAVLNAQ